MDLISYQWKSRRIFSSRTLSICSTNFIICDSRFLKTTRNVILHITLHTILKQTESPLVNQSQLVHKLDTTRRYKMALGSDDNVREGILKLLLKSLN